MTSKAMVKQLGAKILYSAFEDMFGKDRDPKEQLFPPCVKEFYGDHIEIEVREHIDWNGHTSLRHPYNYGKLAIKNKYNSYLTLQYYKYDQNEGYTYSWPGEGNLFSKTLLGLEDFRKLYCLKVEELENAKKKRFNTIKSPVDVLRVFFAEKHINVDRIVGGYRLCTYQGKDREDKFPCCKLVFLDRKNSIEINTCDIGGDHRELLTTIDLADPKFEDKILFYISRLSKIKDFILGGLEPTQT
jgi:hypothetical protein